MRTLFGASLGARTFETTTITPPRPDDTCGRPKPMAVTSQFDGKPRFLTRARQPCEVWWTPFWFRLFLAGLGVVGATLVSLVLAAVLWDAALADVAGDSLRIAFTVAIAVILSVITVRVLNPLDADKWFRLALTPDGLYLRAADSGAVFVPWSAVISVRAAHWEGKGMRSVARLTLDLDENTWARFGRDANVRGEGRVRESDLRLIDATGEMITARINKYRDSAPDIPAKIA